MAAPAVSVIIPVYNAEKYIEECAASLLEQSLKDIEFIFIDDASTDRSLEVLKSVIGRYPERDDCVRLIKHEKNRGISYTRAEGIREARGIRVIHCDSDDWVDKSACQRMLDLAEKDDLDIVVCHFRIFGKNIPEKVNSQGRGKISSIQMLENMAGCGQWQMHGSLCNKLIRRSLFNDVDFPVDLSFCEDLYSLFQILIERPDLKIEVMPEAFYNYRVSGPSLSVRKDERQLENLRQLVKLLEKLKLKATKAGAQALDIKIIFFLYLMLACPVDYKEFSREYHNYRHLIRDNKELRKPEKWQLMLALSGYPSMSRFLGRTLQSLKLTLKRLLSHLR